MLHLVAFGESVLTSGTLQALTPVPDNTVFIDGNNLNVPDTYNMLAAAAALCNSPNSFTEARVQSPSLREMFYPAVTPLVSAATFSGAAPITDYLDNPLALKTNEGLNFYSDAGGDGATAQNPYGLVWLADGPIQPAQGKAFTMRYTAAITLADNTWVNGALTADQVLPVGTYDVVGMRAEGTGLAAARLNFIGKSAVTRPGVPGVASGSVVFDDIFRFGNAGVLGTFDSTTPPSIDALGNTGTAQVIYLDLIQR